MRESPGSTFPGFFNTEGTQGEYSQGFLKPLDASQCGECLPFNSSTGKLWPQREPHLSDPRLIRARVPCRHDGPRPTRRQREYLEFIARYIRRYGISPAESDIGRHFLVSAPSVNQMVQMLERQGFISRQRGVPRSITIIDHPHEPFSE